MMKTNQTAKKGSLSEKSLQTAARFAISGGTSGSTAGDTQDEFSVAVTFTATAGGSFILDPYGTPRLIFNVASQGFNASGGSITVNRTVIGMRVSRRAAPNETQLDVVNNGNGTLTARIVLSEYIHTGDVITLTTVADWYTGMLAETNRPVVNDLAVPYFSPIATWIRHDREIINSATYRPKLVIGHAYARNGRAVAAVRFTLTDQSSNSVTSLVSTVNLEAYSASGLTAEYYGNDINISSLAQGQLITVDAEIFPWVGSSFVISVNGEVYPSPNLSVLQFLNNRTGAYGTVYAYVSPTGVDPGVVDPNPVTAQASPFLTLASAASAIQTYNNTNFARNNVSGGIIRLEAGTTTIPSNTLLSARAVGEIPLVIEAANPANRATTILNWTASGNNNCPDRIKFKDLRLQKGVTGSVTGFDSSATLATLSNFTFVTENCLWDLNSFATYSATVWRVGIYWSINDSCTGAMGHLGRLGTAVKMTIAIGGSSVGESAGSVNHFVAYRDIQSVFGWSTGNADAGRPQAQGNLCAYSFLGRNNGAGTSINTDGVPSGSRGFMIWGSIVEHCNNATTSPSVRLHGDTDITPASNVHVIASTILGSRMNYLYNDTGSVNTKKYGVVRNSIIWQYNNKSDLFAPPDGNRVGCWGATNHVGFGYGAYLTGSASGVTFTDGSWLGEVRAIGEITGTNVTPLTTGFTNDQSGAGTGNGDYHITGASQIPQVPASFMPISFNLFGEAKLLNGLDYAGAV